VSESLSDDPVSVDAESTEAPIVDVGACDTAVSADVVVSSSAAAFDDGGAGESTALSVPVQPVAQASDAIVSSGITRRDIDNLRLSLASSPSQARIA